MLKFSMALILSFTMTTPVLMNPLNLGISVLMMAALTSMFMFLSLYSWASAVLFIIYIGGLMVMFSYFVSIQPNKNTSSNLALTALLMNFMFSMIITPKMYFMFKKTALSYTYVLTHYNMSTLILMASILMISMVIVASMVKSSGSLRPFKM